MDTPEIVTKDHTRCVLCRRAYVRKRIFATESSYGRQFSSAGNFNQWTYGIAYRFLVPLGRTGAQ